MADSVHIRTTPQFEDALKKVKAIMRPKGFLNPNTTEALYFALLDCIANHGKKAK